MTQMADRSQDQYIDCMFCLFVCVVFVAVDVFFGGRGIAGVFVSANLGNDYTKLGYYYEKLDNIDY